MTSFSCVLHFGFEIYNERLDGSLSLLTSVANGGIHVEIYNERLDG